MARLSRLDLSMFEQKRGEKDWRCLWRNLQNQRLCGSRSFSTKGNLHKHIIKRHLKAIEDTQTMISAAPREQPLFPTRLAEPVSLRAPANHIELNPNPSPWQNSTSNLNLDSNIYQSSINDYNSSPITTLPSQIFHSQVLLDYRSFSPFLELPSSSSFDTSYSGSLAPNLPLIAFDDSSPLDLSNVLSTSNNGALPNIPNLRSPTSYNVDISTPFNFSNLPLTSYDHSLNSTPLDLANLPASCNIDLGASFDGSNLPPVSVASAETDHIGFDDLTNTPDLGHELGSANALGLPSSVLTPASQRRSFSSLFSQKSSDTTSSPHPDSPRVLLSSVEGDLLEHPRDKTSSEADGSRQRSKLPFDETSHTAEDSDEAQNDGGSSKKILSPKRNPWLGNSSLLPDVPQYITKRAKLMKQQRGALWVTAIGKDAFDQALASVLAKWHLSPGHKGHCVIMSQQWAGLTPADIMDIVARAELPMVGEAERLRYQYDDHQTSFGRAAAWFGDAHWGDRGPRGVEWDNFLDCSPFKTYDGSHLCHQDLCLLHLCYELSDVNEDRKRCRKCAELLRREDLPVPEYCDQHNPPCMLQDAALTKDEVLYIQVNSYRHTQGLPALPPPPRPRRHKFRTFEYKLPLTFCQSSRVLISAANIITDPTPDAGIQARPTLICPFCSPLIRSYTTILNYWGHIIYKHNGVDVMLRLEEIRRTALSWTKYLSRNGHKSKDDATNVKLVQACRTELDWETVLGWALRR